MLLVDTRIVAWVSPSTVVAKVPEEEVGVRSNGSTLPDREMERVVSEAILVPVRALLGSSSVNIGGHKNTIAITTNTRLIPHNIALSLP